MHALTARSYGSLVEEASGVTIAAGKQRGSARHLYLFEMALLACKVGCESLLLLLFLCSAKAS
jgi:hypothetical protein